MIALVDLLIFVLCVGALVYGARKFLDASFSSKTQQNKARNGFFYPARPSVAYLRHGKVLRNRSVYVGPLSSDVVVVDEAVRTVPFNKFILTTNGVCRIDLSVSVRVFEPVLASQRTGLSTLSATDVWATGEVALTEALQTALSAPTVFSPSLSGEIKSTLASVAREWGVAVESVVVERFETTDSVAIASEEWVSFGEPINRSSAHR